MLRRISAISVVIESIQLEYCLMDVWFQNYSDKVMENCGHNAKRQDAVSE